MNAAQSLQSAVYRLRHAVGPDTAAVTEPSSAMFQAIRWRLTLLYSTVLAIVLLLAGITLYLVVRNTLMGPIPDFLTVSAQRMSSDWVVLDQHLPGPLTRCDFDRLDPLTRGWAYACYDTHGNYIGGSLLAQVLGPTFTNPSLTSTALQNGQAGDTQGSGDSTVQRYAVKVQASDGTTVGVMQVGIQVGTQTTTLHALLEAMLILGIITVLVAALGGLFLANRALLPVRLAYARQRHFIADASHELRTPLTIVRADAEVLLRDRDRFKPDDVAILEDVVSETGHMANLANNMLNLARLEAGGMHMEQDVVDLSSIGREIARRMGPLAAEQDITLRFEDGEPVLVVGDKVQLDQVAVALVDNAIKYNHPGGEVVLRTWVEGQRAHLEVRDTGIGIAAEHLPRLGERFYRVDKARSREIGGAGLGISIVRTIAARHGGSLRYTSQPGQGTTATLTFPAADKGVKGVARAMP